ncbi:ArsR/SmtB family transcription factor [Streptomyces sp. enrichment culture]|uniref:ArsR/SmtB family transcription factor n=1 Tax=Streptomyces sp. enrichment culture TaxID=1795815 RepID=UPI003F56D27B
MGGTVRLGPVEQVQVRVARHPGATLFSVLKDVFGGHRHGVPALWRESVRRAIPPGAAAVVGPSLASGDCWLPDPLALVGDLWARGMGDVAGELEGLDAEALAAEVAGHHGAVTPRGWRRLLDDPQGFLTAYRAVVGAAWDAFAPLWRQADPLLGRESERVGLASVTGGLDALLAGLDSTVRYGAGALALPHECPRHLTDLGRRPLVLVPLASGPGARMYGADRDDALWIAYPVPGLGRIAGRRGAADAAPPPADGLSAVLGPVRAEILRFLPYRPTVSALARHLHLSISTATYHCGQLADAGLLHRERHGREVRLLPSERGIALTELLAAPVRTPAG